MTRRTRSQHDEPCAEAVATDSAPASVGSTAWPLGRLETALGLVILAAVLALAAFARLKALGAAPLAVDEYFLLRSTQNVLHHGWPVFDCGGVYSRGLILQYLAAALNLLGVSSDVAPRLVSAASSLLGLPAAYLLGRRVRGPLLGWLAVIILALSLWETEMARFGRMYAPFQAVFLWYLVCFVRRSVDDDARADWPMLVLTLIGGLLWEGGVFLALANFMPVFLRRRSLGLSRSEWLGLLKFVPVFIFVYWFVTTDFRMLGDSPALPPDYDPATANTTADFLSGAPALWAALRMRHAWLLLYLAPLAASVVAVRALWTRRCADLTTLGLLAALVAALAHQLLAAAALWVLLPLFRFSSWSQLSCRAARAVYFAMGVCAAFWLAFLCFSWNRPAGTGLWKTVVAFVFPLVSRPDVIDQVVWPWAGAVPMLGLGLLLLLAAAYVRVLRRDEPGVGAERALLALLFCLLLAACASTTPRHETRYVFFLYPIAVIVALNEIATLVGRSPARGRAAVALTAVAAMGLFMLSEDFRPRNLLEVSSPASIFRVGMSPRTQEHLVMRADTRALARWLQQHAGGDAVVINAYQSLDYYDPKIDFFYVDRSDYNFEAYSCRSGTIERWSNRPLLQSVGALEAVIASRPRTYLVTYAARLKPLLPQLARYRPQIAWSGGFLAVVTFARPAPRSERPV